MRRSMLGLAVAAMLAFSLAPGVSAQATYTLSGVVTDQDGAPVAGASVSWYQYGEVDCEAAPPQGDQTEPVRDCGDDGRGDYHEASSTTAADGRFSLAVREGWGSLQVWKDGHANHHDGFEVAGDHQVEVELVKFPEKTARLEGRITPGASISIENPVYGTYECSQLEGTGEPKPEPRPMEPATDGGGSDSSEGNTSMTIAPDWYPGCAITVRADGSYFGNVTPGYSIIRVHGGWSQSGESHYSHSTVRDLAADATTRLDVALKARPGPDADLSGYVVDGATQTAIPGAQVSFSNQDSHGWASAQTDGDGSYKVALRSGFVHVQVWADGHLPWEGQVELASGAPRSLDIVLTQGESRYGGCCIAYAGETDAPSLASDDLDKAAQEEATGRQTDEAGAPNDFEDFGGGLGPYDPARADAEAQESPGIEVFAFIGLLSLLAFIRRR